MIIETLRNRILLLKSIRLMLLMQKSVFIYRIDFKVWTLESIICACYVTMSFPVLKFEQARSTYVYKLLFCKFCKSFRFVRILLKNQFRVFIFKALCINCVLKIHIRVYITLSPNGIGRGYVSISHPPVASPPS